MKKLFFISLLALASCSNSPIHVSVSMDNDTISTPKVSEVQDPEEGDKLQGDIELADMDGNKHMVSDYIGKGQYVLVDFWASWCGPCCHEMPNVVANYKKYHDKGFQILGISLDEDAAAWKEATDKLGITWNQLSDLKGWKSVACVKYDINAIPTNFLVDPEGKVIATGLRDEDLGKKLAEIYK